MGNDEAAKLCCRALLVVCELNDQRAIDMTCKILMESLGNTTEAAKRNAMNCIVLLIKGNEAVLELLMDSNILSNVVPLMSSSIPKIQSLASAIGCIASQKYARQVVVHGCINIFFGLLISSNSGTVDNSVIALLRVSFYLLLTYHLSDTATQTFALYFQILEFGRKEGDQNITSVIRNGISMIETKLGELDFNGSGVEEEMAMYKNNMPLYKAL